MSIIGWGGLKPCVKHLVFVYLLLKGGWGVRKNQKKHLVPMGVRHLVPAPACPHRNWFLKVDASFLCNCFGENTQVFNDFKEKLLYEILGKLFIFSIVYKKNSVCNG